MHYLSTLPNYALSEKIPIYTQFENIKKFKYKFVVVFI